MGSNWINNFAPISDNISSTPLQQMGIRNIDELYTNKKTNNENVVKLLELKGEILSLIDGRDEFELLEDEKKDIDEAGKDENIIKEIDELNETIQKYLENFTDIQNELNKCNQEYKNEVNILKKNISTTENMIEFIEKIPDDQKDEENVKNIIKQMNILSKNLLNSEKIKNIRKKYIEKRKESEKIITFIKKINNLNQTNICPVCFTNTVDHFLEPCGHTFCKECIEKHLKNDEEIEQYEIGRNNNSQCCFCRVTINNVKPLYFL